MIFNFKDDLLLIKILNILKQIACEKKSINYRKLKRLLIVKIFLKAVTRAPHSAPDVLDYEISYVRLMYAFL